MNVSRSTRATLLTAVLTTAVLLTACEDARIGGAPDNGDETTLRGEYAREMMFVAGDAAGGAVFDFTAADVGTAVRRTARAWTEAGSGWAPLYDLSWQGSAMRRAWRLVPHGPMRLRVGLNDDVEAVLVREGADDIAALEHGAFISAWTPQPTAQVVLREASLTVGSETMTGWLVDARFGVTAAAAAMPDDEPASIGTPSDGDASDTSRSAVPDSASAAAAQATAHDSAAAADSAGARAESIEATDLTDARSTSESATNGSVRIRSIRALLVGDDGETLVIGDAENGMAGWFYSADRERTLPLVTLTTVAGERESWSLGTADGAVIGTVTVMDEQPMPVSPRIVRGTIRLGEEELELHGVLRASTAAP